jgi:hypothetical protein
LSDVLEELLTENDPTIRYNFVIMDDCLIFARVAHLHHVPYYILGKHISLSNRSRDVRFAGELWYDKDNGFQLNNNSGTYRPSQGLIVKTVDLFNYLTPELQFTGTGFQQNSSLSIKDRIMLRIKEELNVKHDPEAFWTSLRVDQIFVYN